jgi:DNA-directed RNA polymerase specialized sigma24 family protein
MLRSGRRNAIPTEDLTLLHQQDCRPRHAHKWDDGHTHEAIAAARQHAARWARRGRRGGADRDDLSQDILLAIVERARHFDAEQANWAAFVGLLARHVVADRLKADSLSSRVTWVPLDHVDLDAGATLTSATQHVPSDDVAAIACRVDLDALVDDLPIAPREILLLLMASHGDIAAARRASGRSCSSFYRMLDELRLWLRAGGLRVASHARGKNRALDR